jgi:hypothetical protein
VRKLLRLELLSIIFDDPIGAATVQIGPICSSNQKRSSSQTWKGICGWMVDEFMKEGLVELLARETGNCGGPIFLFWLAGSNLVGLVALYLDE